MAGSLDINTLFGPLPASSTDLPVDELGALMQKHGVGACCTMSTVGLLLDHVSGNAATLAACRDAPALIAVGTVNPMCYFGGEGAAQQFVDDGFRMVRFFPEAQGWPIRFAPFSTLLRTLAERKLPVMVNVAQPGDATELADLTEGLDCRIVLAGVNDRQVAEAIAVLRSRQGFFVETSGLAAAGVVKLLVAGVGAERVLFGSAAPAQPMGSALAAVRRSGVPEGDHAAILGGNARALLGI